MIILNFINILIATCGFLWAIFIAIKEIREKRIELEINREVNQYNHFYDSFEKLITNYHQELVDLELLDIIYEKRRILSELYLLINQHKLESKFKVELYDFYENISKIGLIHDFEQFKAYITKNELLFCDFDIFFKNKKRKELIQNNG